MAAKWFHQNGWVYECIGEPEPTGGACFKCVYERETLTSKIKDFKVVWPTDVFDTYRAAVERAVAHNKERAWYWQNELNKIHEADDAFNEAATDMAVASAGYVKPEAKADGGAK